MKRITFNIASERIYFFDELFRFLRVKTWKEVYRLFNVPKSVFEKYRTGYLTLPAPLFVKICEKLPKDRVIYYNARISYLGKYWGMAKGGEITYSKHKEIFDKGRILGSQSESRKLNRKYKIEQNMILDEYLSYFIGLFIAEGFTNVYGRHYQTQFTGNWSEEFEFYDKVVRGIVKDLFDITPYIRKDRIANAVRFNLFSKDLFSMITNRFNIKAGRKSHNVLIPKEISSSSRENLMSCLSGIFDGEACFFVDNRKVYAHPYPRIDLHMVNPGIIEQISDILNKEGIKHGIVGDFSRINIYGEKNVTDFLRKVGFSNLKHLIKIKKHFGNIEVKRLI